MPTTRKQTVEKVLVQAWVDPELEHKLKAMAEAAHRTKAAELTLAIEEHVVSMVKT